MADREKVLCALENCTQQPKCRDCPWVDCEVEHEIINGVPYGLLRDAIALLKEQEATIDAAPVKHGRWVRLDIPIGEPDFKCTACNISVHVPTCMGEPMYEYCPVCGAVMDLQEGDDAVSG